MTSEINTPFCVKNTITTDISNSFFCDTTQTFEMKFNFHANSFDFGAILA